MRPIESKVTQGYIFLRFWRDFTLLKGRFSIGYRYIQLYPLKNHRFGNSRPSSTSIWARKFGSRDHWNLLETSDLDFLISLSVFNGPVEGIAPPLVHRKYRHESGHYLTSELLR